LLALIGKLWSEMPEDVKKQMFEATAAKLPVGHVGTPDEIVEAYLYLMRYASLTTSPQPDSLPRSPVKHLLTCSTLAACQMRLRDGRDDPVSEVLMRSFRPASAWLTVLVGFCSIDGGHALV
jgi:hypothetical protein